MTPEERTCKIGDWPLQHSGCDPICPLHAAIRDAIRAAVAEERADLDRVFPMLDWLLVRIGSWTSARWDQHLRDEFGDERADELIGVMDAIRALPLFQPEPETEVKP